MFVSSENKCIYLKKPIQLWINLWGLVTHLKYYVKSARPTPDRYDNHRRHGPHIMVQGKGPAIVNRFAPEAGYIYLHTTLQQTFAPTAFFFTVILFSIKIPCIYRWESFIYCTPKATPKRPRSSGTDESPNLSVSKQASVWMCLDHHSVQGFVFAPLRNSIAPRVKAQQCQSETSIRQLCNSAFLFIQ